MQDQPTSEKWLERRLVQAVTQAGGIALKQTSQFHRGIPDRLILLPFGRVDWVELKTEGKKPTRLQSLTHEQLRNLSQRVFIISTKEELQNYLSTIRV